MSPSKEGLPPTRATNVLDLPEPMQAHVRRWLVAQQPPGRIVYWLRRKGWEISRQATIDFRLKFDEPSVMPDEANSCADDPPAPEPVQGVNMFRVGDEAIFFLINKSLKPFQGANGRARVVDTNELEKLGNVVCRLFTTWATL